jgi:hypothetical protein
LLFTRIHQLLCVFGILLCSYPASLAFAFDERLVEAADRGYLSEVKGLLVTESPDVSSDFGSTPLMRASLRGHKDVVAALLEKGASPNLTDVGGATALHLAVRQGQTEIAQLLLDANADANAVDSEGWTPLMRATQQERQDTVELLLKRGADRSYTNQSGDNAVTIAAKAGNRSIMEALLSGGADSAQLEEARTLATQRNNQDILAVLDAAAAAPPTPAAPGGSENTTAIASAATVESAPSEVVTATAMEEPDFISPIKVVPAETTVSAAAPVSTLASAPLNNGNETPFAQLSALPPILYKTMIIPAANADAIETPTPLYVLELGIGESPEAIRNQLEALLSTRNLPVDNLYVTASASYEGNSTYRIRSPIFEEKADARTLCKQAAANGHNCMLIETKRVPSVMMPGHKVASRMTSPGIAMSDSSTPHSLVPASLQAR